jgi:hypothetical protein
MQTDHATSLDMMDEIRQMQQQLANASVGNGDSCDNGGGGGGGDGSDGGVGSNDGNAVLRQRIDTLVAIQVSAITLAFVNHHLPLLSNTPSLSITLVYVHHGVHLPLLSRH